MVRAIINGNVYNRRIDSNTNNPLVAHDSDEYSTSLGTKTSFHASNRKPKTRGRSFPIPRVTPLSRARGYRINSSIQTRLRLTSRKSWSRAIKICRRTRHLLFRERRENGYYTLHSPLLQRVIFGRVISPSIYEALRHPEDSSFLAFPLTWGIHLYELGSQPCNRRPLYRWTFTTADGQCWTNRGDGLCA